MRVGLDGIPLANTRTGVGHYTFELARHLALINPDDTFELLSPFRFDPTIQNEQLPSNLRLVQQKVNSVRRRWLAVGLPLHLRRLKFDLFHGTNYEVPLWSKCAKVLTIHDLSILLHPETHEDRLVRRGRRRLPTMARTADCIITPSETIKREVMEYLGVTASWIVVIPYAARSVFRPLPINEAVETRNKLGIEPEFILFTGTIEPRKNLKTLLQAFQKILESTNLRPQLVIAGKQGWLSDGLFTQVNAMGLADRLRFTGYVSDDDLRALYSSCRAFVYPSLYEGFGLPLLEAMACGAPVITSQVPSIIETTGSEAARHVQPLDASSLAQAIVGLLENASERQYLSSAGLRHAEKFSWERVALSTADVYREVAKSRISKRRDS
ncbi:MAG TPA: glycosyltransferase family 1 protein [Pyrinomonadaceae bacterium]|nr:glycosyltransferase family 1 protein [Pyrinomonadaceae bacterium]